MRMVSQYVATKDQINAVLFLSIVKKKKKSSTANPKQQYTEKKYIRNKLGLPKVCKDGLI